MSEYQAAKGRIVELYAELATPKEKVEKLSEHTGIPVDDLIWDDDYSFIDNNDYALLHGRLFDISDAHPTYEDEVPEREIVKRVSEGVYDIDLYYYNGGTNMQELLEKHLQDEPEDDGGKLSKLEAYISEYLYTQDEYLDLNDVPELAKNLAVELDKGNFV